MKHIKSFENKTINDQKYHPLNEPKYEAGDYVIINFKHKNNKNSIFKILSYHKYNLYYLEDQLESINSGLYLEEDIIRKATPQEILELQIEINSKKYNL